MTITPNVLMQSDVHALPVLACNDSDSVISTICVDLNANIAAIFYWKIATDSDKSIQLKLYDWLRRHSQKPHILSKLFAWLMVRYAMFFELELEYSGIQLKIVPIHKLTLKKARVIRDLLGVELIHYIVIVGDEGNCDFYITEQTERQLSAIPLNRFID